MNRIAISAAFALTLVLPLAGPAAFAQAGDVAAHNQAQTASAQHVHNPHSISMKLGRKLNLTADQTAKLEPILAERQQKRQAVKTNTALTPEQMHQQLHAISKSTRDQMAGVLTPDQMQQMKAMHKSHEAKANSAAPTGV